MISLETLRKIVRRKDDKKLNINRIYEKVKEGLNPEDLVSKSMLYPRIKSKNLIKFVTLNLKITQ